MTPTLDRADTIDRTITSVLMQEGDFDLHYHVQDGGSDEGTLQILTRWKSLLDEGLAPIACRSVQFTYTREPDDGLYDAVCRGFERLAPSPESWMTWLNADDILLPGAGAFLARVDASRPSIGWVTGGGAVMKYGTQVAVDERPLSSLVIREGLCDGHHWHFVQQEGTFWRHRLWRSVDLEGGFRRMRLAGDWNLWRMFAANHPLHQVDRPLGMFRFRDGQLSQVARAEYLQETEELVPMEERAEALRRLAEGHPQRIVLTMGHDGEVYVRLESLRDEARRWLRARTGVLFDEDGDWPVVVGGRSATEAVVVPTDAHHAGDEDDPGRTVQDWDGLKGRHPRATRLIVWPLRRAWSFAARLALAWNRANPLFDEDFYLATYPDVRSSGLSAYRHYRRHGAGEGRKPNQFFDADWYLAQYPEIAAQAIDPLDHYLRYGCWEAKNPSTRFDTRWYLTQHPELVEQGINPLLHFLLSGRAQGHLPAPPSAPGDGSEEQAATAAASNYYERPADLVAGGLDRLIYVPNGGFVMIGWLFDPQKRVVSVGVQTDTGVVSYPLERFIRLPRPDVSEAKAEWTAVGQTEQHGMLGYLRTAEDISASDLSSLALRFTEVDGRSWQLRPPRDRRDPASPLDLIRELLTIAPPQDSSTLEDQLGPAILVILGESDDSLPGHLVDLLLDLGELGRIAEARLLVKAATDQGRIPPELLVQEQACVEAAELLRIDSRDLPRRAVDRLGTLARRPPAELDAPGLWQLARLMFHANRGSEALSAVVHATDRGSFSGGMSVQAAHVIRFLLGLPSDAALPEHRVVLGRQMLERGLSMVAMRQTSQAASCFAVARALTPDDMAARLNAGFFLHAAGLHDAAEVAFRPVRKAEAKQLVSVAWPAPGGRPWPWGAVEPTPDEAAAGEWPRISIVTPSLNQGQYIEETILSVLKQGYPNLQYIVVDGGSSDETEAVLRRYAASIDHLVIEDDRGQADAINKGLRIADGDLVTWLNSDDMFAPGALHAMAAAWRERPADLLYGISLVHRDYRFEMVKLAAVTQGTFTTRHLSDISNYWMKAHYFSQPEVMFTRSLLERVGGELAELYFTMDYELWLRFAEAGAQIQAVHWPIALFRLHSAQKTSQMTNCVIEQAEVRTRAYDFQPSTDRRKEVQDRLAAALSSDNPRVALVSARSRTNFSPDSAPDLAHELAKTGCRVELLASMDEGADDFDLAIFLMHLQDEQGAIKRMRDRGNRIPTLGWFWGNHHRVFDNAAGAEVLDVVVPGHAFASSYLASRRSVLSSPVPLCVTEWSKREAATFFGRVGTQERSERLYCSFAEHAAAEERSTLVDELIEAGDAGTYLVEERGLSRYSELTQAQRFEELSSHKTSLCLPLTKELPQRLFDALLTGQVPIAPKEMPDLDLVVPPALQRELPIIRFEQHSVESIRKAHRAALAAFDRGGETGLRRRHEFALNEHMMPTRVETIIGLAREISRGVVR